MFVIVTHFNIAGIVKSIVFYDSFRSLQIICTKTKYTMKYLIIATCNFISIMTGAQKIDTFINTGKYNLHFTIIRGKGLPILFEAGGGNDGSIWKNIITPVAAVTGATVITYDRAGLGKSGIDSTDMSIENDTRALEKGLAALGYDKKMMLVSHSMGGFYNALYAARNPAKVKAIVFIDANLPCFFTPAQFEKMNASQRFKGMVETVRQHPLPATIPVTDIVSEKTLFEGTADADRWKACHHDFATAAPNRTALIAYETGHYIFLQNSQLVINAIVTMYANEVMPSQKAAILERGYAQALQAANDNHKKEINYQHSEDDLNEWGYAFYQKNELEKAIGIFQLNVLLHPGSANVYDSLGDAYRKAGNKELAIQNYKKALELDPAKKSARKALEQLLN